MGIDLDKIGHAKDILDRLFEKPRNKKHVMSCLKKAKEIIEKALKSE